MPFASTSALPFEVSALLAGAVCASAGTASRRIATKLKLIFFTAGSPVFLNLQRANTRKLYVFQAWKLLRHSALFGSRREIGRLSVLQLFIKCLCIEQ